MPVIIKWNILNTFSCERENKISILLLFSLDLNNIIISFIYKYSFIYINLESILNQFV